MKTVKILVTILAVLGLALTACGGPAATPTATAVPVKPTAAPTAVPAAKLDMGALVDKYITGIPDTFYGLTAAAAKETIDATKPFLVDVRDAKSITDGGTIAGSVNIPLKSLIKNLDKLPAQDKPIIVFCGIGHAGAQGMEALQLLGYADVKTIFGGYEAWKAAKLPTVPAAIEAKSGTAPKIDPELLAAIDKYISGLPDDFDGVPPAAAKDRIAAEKPLVIDFRDAKDVANGFIAGAVNIPLRTLTKSMDKLPKDKSSPIIVYCGIGHAGAMGAEALRLLGYTNVKSIFMGFSGWKEAGLPVAK